MHKILYGYTYMPVSIASSCLSTDIVTNCINQLHFSTLKFFKSSSTYVTGFTKTNQELKSKLCNNINDLLRGINCVSIDGQVCFQGWLFPDPVKLC